MSLNEYSKRAKDSLAEYLPVLTSELQEQPNGSFLIEALSSSGITFWLSSEGDEITVGFDLHHVHFGNLSDPDPVEDVRETVLSRCVDGSF